MPIVAPSILAANIMNLDSEVAMINQSTAEWIHIDVMDGRFVPNISFGMPIVKGIRQKTAKVLDVHLMIVEPEKYVEDFAKAGADVITIHAEACTHLHRNLQQIRQFGKKAGIALNPHTSISVLENVIDLIDVVCLMSVNPGFGGQAFIQHTYGKLTHLSALLKASSSPALIEIDGGVTLDNAPLLTAAGAHVLVAGNTVFTAPHPIQCISKLQGN
ncbi:MAG: ribulose-phosphate 3-epimerase [Chitinophagia bacterium]|nr:ribulose-phosphate 3-epimerase [Chitinophagia bacterium]